MRKIIPVHDSNTAYTGPFFWSREEMKAYIYILSVYSPFSDRVGLPLHNIHSPFLSVMDIILKYKRNPNYICEFI